MPVRTAIDPIDRDIKVLLDGLSPTARSAALAEFATEALADAESTDARALGHVPQHQTFVDGVEGAAVDTVRPDGVIIFEFQLLEDVFAWIDDQLIQNSPIGSSGDKHAGLYQKSHIFFADGVEADPRSSPPPQASEYVFLNAQPYARKIEGHDGVKPESSQAPEGVFESVAKLASDRFGNVAKIAFDFRSADGVGDIEAWASHTRLSAKGHRPGARGYADWLRAQPAIIVTLRS